jgi:hypothetical protein
MWRAASSGSATQQLEEGDKLLFLQKVPWALEILEDFQNCTLFA